MERIPLIKLLTILTVIGCALAPSALHANATFADADRGVVDYRAAVAEPTRTCQRSTNGHDRLHRQRIRGTRR